MSYNQRRLSVHEQKMFQSGMHRALAVATHVSRVMRVVMVVVLCPEECLRGGDAFVWCKRDKRKRRACVEAVSI